MYCKNCGKKIPESSKFCRHCGEKLNSNEDKKNTEVDRDTKHSDDKRTPDKDDLKKLHKRYKDTGNTSIALGILALIFSFILSLSEYEFTDTLVGAIILVPFLIPFYYYGKKLKEEGHKDLEYSLKVSKGMLIYTIIIVVINLALGEMSGWLWFLLIYYYYKSFKETKDVLSI